jgi:hypothetical protein
MNTSTTTSNENSQLGIYISAALGALFLGIGDLLNNNTAATVLKLSETIRQYLYPSLESGGLVALALLAILGAAVCWVQQPHTRVDAFSRGFSVFALLAVTTPYHPTTTGLDHPPGPHPTSGGIGSLFGISVAYADDDTPTIPLDITLEPRTATTLPSDTQVILREFDTGKIVGTSKISSGKFSINQPRGRYLLEVEAPGFRRTATELKVDGASQRITVPIEDSSIPLSIQRLYAPERATEKK